MVDKSARQGNPKGKEYCDTPGTACYYGPNDICVNCGRKKGWRQKKQFSAQQRRVMNTPGIEFLGIDSKNRPAVRGEVGIPKQIRHWAILRNGDPTDIVGEVRNI